MHPTGWEMGRKRKREGDWGELVWDTCHKNPF